MHPTTLQIDHVEHNLHFQEGFVRGTKVEGSIDHQIRALGNDDNDVLLDLIQRKVGFLNERG